MCVVYVDSTSDRRETQGSSAPPRVVMKSCLHAQAHVCEPSVCACVSLDPWFLVIQSKKRVTKSCRRVTTSGLPVLMVLLLSSFLLSLPSSNVYRTLVLACSCVSLFPLFRSPLLYPCVSLPLLSCLRLSLSHSLCLSN